MTYEIVYVGPLLMGAFFLFLDGYLPVVTALVLFGEAVALTGVWWLRNRE